MINKQNLVSIIDKYYLNGIGEKVKWSVKDNNVTIKTFSPTKDMVGIVEAPFVFPDCEFVIFDTSKFLKLISVCGQDIVIDILYKEKIATKLLIADKEYNLEYALANLMLAPQVNFTVSDFDHDYSFNIDNELINIWIKAKKALGSDTFTIKSYVNPTSVPSVYFTLGEIDGHSNKIMFETPTLEPVLKESANMKFDADYLKAIFDANYGAQGTAFVNNDGAIKLDFKTEDDQISSYIILAKI
jgi:hypothetical protein